MANKGVRTALATIGALLFTSAIYLASGNVAATVTSLIGTILFGLHEATS